MTQTLKIGSKVTVLNFLSTCSGYSGIAFAYENSIPDVVRNLLPNDGDEGEVVHVGGHVEGYPVVAIKVTEGEKTGTFIIRHGGVSRKKTVAEVAGLVIGQAYTLSCESAETYSGVADVFFFTEDDGSLYPYFGRTNNAEDKTYCFRVNEVVPYKVKTPAETAGFVVGERYTVAATSGSWARGKVVVFYSDDGTTSPHFKNPEGLICNPYLHELTLAPVPTTIVFDKVLTEAQIAAIKALVA